MGTDGHGWARMGTDGHGWLSIMILILIVIEKMSQFLYLPILVGEKINHRGLREHRGENQPRMKGWRPPPTGATAGWCPCLADSPSRGE